MKKIKVLSVITCILLSAVLLASCSANAGDVYYDNIKSESMNMDAGVPSDKPSVDDNFGGLNSDSALGGSTESGEYQRKIIKTVNMTAETKEYDKAIGDINQAIATYGGYVESSGTSGKSYDNYGTFRRHASFVIRIPAENLDAFLGGLTEILNVTDNRAAINDVSGKYYDIVSRLETLNAEKDALMAMYEKAETIDYMLQVQQRLYDVIEEIEAYTTTLNYYDGQVSYSTVNLSLNEVVEFTDVSDPITYGERMAEAFKDSWKDFAKGCQDFSIWFVGAIPTLLVLAVIGCGVAGIIVLILRADHKKKLEKKAKKETDAK